MKMQGADIENLQRSVLSHGENVVIPRRIFEELVDGYCAETNYVFRRIREVENRLNRILKENRANDF